MLSPQQYGKFMLLAAIGFLFIWMGISGRVGSLFGAILTPGFMVEGTPPGPGGTSSSGNNSNNQNKGNGVTPPGANQLNMTQIASFAYTAGLTAQNTLAMAIAICMAESGGKTQNVNGQAIGLWQILLSAHPEYTRAQMLDPAQNAAAMAKISSNGTNWCAWQSFSGSGCTTGIAYNNSYAAFLPQANTAAQNYIATRLTLGTM